MQFRGHSLPVHQSMNVSWAFTLSHFVSQICLRDFFRLLAIGMCHFLPVHPFGMACLAGSKVKIQHTQNLSNRFQRVSLGTELVWFYGISTSVGYLMPDLVQTCIFIIIIMSRHQHGYDLVWLGFMSHELLQVI